MTVHPKQSSGYFFVSVQRRSERLSARQGRHKWVSLEGVVMFSQLTAAADLFIQSADHSSNRDSRSTIRDSNTTTWVL